MVELLGLAVFAGMWWVFSQLRLPILWATLLGLIGTFVVMPYVLAFVAGLLVALPFAIAAAVVAAIGFFWWRWATADPETNHFRRW